MIERIRTCLQVGAELAAQTADTRDGRASLDAGFGLTRDLSDNLHLLACAGPGLANMPANPRYDWYASMLFTF